jgi:hypothetical protein
VVVRIVFSSETSNRLSIECHSGISQGIVAWGRLELIIDLGCRLTIEAISAVVSWSLASISGTILAWWTLNAIEYG